MTSILLRVVALLSLLVVQAHACAFKQPNMQPSALGRHLQRQENESDPATTDFLAKTDGAEDLSSVAAFIDALVETEEATTDSPFYSNWSTAIRHRDDDADEANSDEDTEFEDVGVELTPSPELNMADASASLEDVAGSAVFNSSGDQEPMVGDDDANMADGKAVPSNSAPLQLSSAIAAWIIAFAIALDMAN
ncbi:hypothetical protein PHYSODRAFT_362321 [Phytophthora sojae]|uniref:RxLR effector protein n=1 Tax=Phytophthora sojae (strain P6497) TaxID=1094619 RepID=G5ABK3_PHYSP|nr:hypothetical protein PHYSODRAFT_362321 [Phytophthora sojae]EGZ06728.1 hypothetical protein PHYSODRAFT_362321 [Phytophthora sojae]|eukprot:XP_009537492.1 hypothetical protein PHYSODRAFT_362321 [Phytophthora sojae]